MLALHYADMELATDAVLRTRPGEELLNYLMDVRPLPAHARNDREYCGHEET
jgi:hypothetical protein